MAIKRILRASDLSPAAVAVVRAAPCPVVTVGPGRR